MGGQKRALIYNIPSYSAKLSSTSGNNKMYNMTVSFPYPVASDLTINVLWEYYLDKYGWVTGMIDNFTINKGAQQVSFFRI